MSQSTGAHPDRRLHLHPLLHDHPRAWRIARALWLVAALLFAAIAIEPIRETVERIDQATFDWAVDAEWEPAVIGAKVLDFLGSVWVTVPIMLATTAWLWLRRRWEALTTWLVAMVVSQLFIGPVKALYQRARPPQALVETSSWSFPSGHSVSVAAIAVALVIVLVPAGPRRRNLEMLAAGTAVVMALSRVYLRAHWLSDVAAGAALGVAIAIGAAAMVHRRDAKRHETAT